MNTVSRYLIRYTIFWVPAVLVFFLWNNQSRQSLILQWFCAFFMLFGWSVTTGLAAYSHPRKAFGLLLSYTGAHLLIMAFLYYAPLSRGMDLRLRTFLGILSYTPMDIMLRALLDFNIPHEIYVIFIIAACSFVGLLVGILQRWLHPDPYHPKMAGH